MSNNKNIQDSADRVLSVKRNRNLSGTTKTTVTKNTGITRLEFCLYNAIKTPDGTILHCDTEHSYREHLDTVSGEEYFNDGAGYSVRRSVNKVPYEDLSISTKDPFEKIRTAKFWGSYGKDGKQPKKMMCMQEMEKAHVEAILQTQTRIRGTIIEELFKQELEYRITTFKNELDEKIPERVSKNKKMKV